MGMQQCYLMYKETKKFLYNFSIHIYFSTKTLLSSVISLYFRWDCVVLEMGILSKAIKVRAETVKSIAIGIPSS